MSHIPNSAMPHAKPSEETGNETDGNKKSVSARAAKLKDKARENPKTAIAAGAAVLAGAVAAVAVPAVRRRKKSAEEGGAGASESGSSSSKGSKKKS